MEAIGIIAEVKALLDAVGGLLNKRTASKAEQNRDKTVVAIFRLGNQNHRFARAGDLEAAGFTKLQVHDAIEAAEARGWLVDGGSAGGLAWALNHKGAYYAQALIEAAQE